MAFWTRCLISSMLLRFAVTAAAQTSPQTQEDFPTRVQQAIGLKPGKGDVLAPLAEVVSSVKKSGPNLDKDGYLAIDKLVVAVGQDADTSPFEAKVVSAIKVSEGNGKFKPPDGWKYGTYIDLGQISAKLYDLAKPLKLKDPDRAARYAQAALVLGAMTYFEARASVVRNLIDDKDFSSVSGLKESQLNSVRDLVKTVDDQMRVYSTQLFTILTSEESLIGKSGLLNENDLTAGLTALAAAWKVAGSDRGEKFQLSWLIWEYLNMANLRHDQNAADKIEALVKSWQETDKDETVERWLKEVLTVRSKEMPTSHIGRVSK